MAEKSDTQANNFESLRDKHRKMLFKIKLIILTFYTTNYLDAFFIYLPNRMDVSNEYSMALCVGKCHLYNIIIDYFI